MSKKRTSITLFFLLLLSILVISPAYNVKSADWSSWSINEKLYVQNNATVELPIGYTVSMVLDTATIILQGDMLSDCSDLRISYEHSGVDTELDRLVEDCDSATTTIRFQTQSAIPAGSKDTEYLLHYGNLTPGSPPENRNYVYTFYDDFQDGDAAGWNAADGTWTIMDETGNYFYRYTGGGSGWAISYVTLPDVSDLDYVAKIRSTDSPFTNFIGLAYRIADQNNFMTLYQSRDVNPDQFKLARIIGDAHSIQLFPVSIEMLADSWYWLRLQAIGSTVRARIWQDGTTEPTNWLIETTDSTFQTEANIGATLYNHTTNADWDEIQVRKLVDTEPTVQPLVWWDNDWGYRKQLSVSNTSGSESLQGNYAASFTLDTEVLIDAGQMLIDCSDLRITSVSGINSTEIDRVVENCDTSQTTVWFALQRPIASGGSDNGYFVYYGNSSAGAPPADGMSVFLFFEDWEQTASHWISAGGLDIDNTGDMGSTSISTDEAFSPSNSQMFPVKLGGGDAFSGFIPVAPSTGYSIGVWGYSPDENVWAPVGFDPYDSAKTQGTETWLWTSEWNIGPQWSHRSGSFTSAGNTAYIKIKSELWTSSPGDPPLYFDNLFLRYMIDSEPDVVPGDEETILSVPEITNIQDDGPVELGTSINISTDISSLDGTIDVVTLKMISPESVDIPMSLISGTDSDGTWQGSFSPNQGGTYQYRVLALASTGLSTLSEENTFLVTDSQSPQISLVSIIDPILVRETQTLVVDVTDNGQISQVNLTVGGDTYPMTQSGSEYSSSWKVWTVGVIPYSVEAEDTSGNRVTLNGNFTSEAREVEVCTWWGCKNGAASFSMDDGNTACFGELNAAGLNGTYYYNGSSTLSWFATYSAVGHEIASHTVGHPCNPPCCFDTCTPESLANCPYTQTDVDDFRQNQLDANIQAIEAGTGLPSLSLAWPCGCTDPGRMEAASYYYLGARGYYDYIAELDWLQDVNEPTPVNFMNLNSANSYDQTFIDQAINEGKWAIITSHGSCSGITYMSSQQDVLWVAPVGEVLKYIKVRDDAQFNNYNRVGRTISFDVAHSLDTFNRQTYGGTPLLPITYDNAVTIKAHILETDDVLSVLVDGNPVTFQIQNLDGTKHVTFDTSLEVSRNVEINLAQPAPIIGQITDNSPIELGDLAQVTAEVTNPDGTVDSVTLHLETPIIADYLMSRVGITDNYTADFITSQLSDHTYWVTASNDEGNSSQSSTQTLSVVDTTPPGWRNQSQQTDFIQPSDPIQLISEGMDLGGLDQAILMTDESGSWQEFTYPITDWWDHSWPYRRSVTLTESDGLDRTNELVDMVISADQFTSLTSCTNELRVADSNRNEIPIQIYDEHFDGGILTCNLVFQASVNANSSQTNYIYYGNSGAAAPVYTTDLTSSSAAGLTTVANSFFNLDLDNDGGVISRVQLPQGSNTILPLSPETDSYWGWHQVCSSGDGNITGKNNLCNGGTAPASGLTLQTTIDGPIIKEFSFSSIKGAATYTMIFRFFANTPYYQYNLSRAGTTASVMNNFWYANGNFGRLGTGTTVSPATVYNIYDDSTDHVRLSSSAIVDINSIEGTDNDGTDLGGTDYETPTAAGLDLYITIGSDQTAAQQVVEKIHAPVTSIIGDVEDAPFGQYNSPIDLNGATDWNSTAFNWQNPAILDCSQIQWRVKYCDLSDNCNMTDIMHFNVVSAVTPANVYVDDTWVNTLVCTDPDGSGLATSYGKDAFAGIQAGINAAATGGTILVESGDYAESIDLNKDAIVLVNGDINVTGDLTIQQGTFTAPSGNMSLSGDFSFSGETFTHNDGTLLLNGSTPQSLGGSLATVFNNITVNNTSGVLLDQVENVIGILTLTNGHLTLGSNDLTLGTAASSTGSFSSSNMIVADSTGALCKQFGSAGSYTYPIGDATGTANYSPASLNFHSGTFGPGQVCINLTDAKHPNNGSPQNYLSRYWTASSSGISDFTTTASFYYDGSTEDIVGSENLIYALKYDNNTWTTGALVEPSTHSFSIPVDSFSDFTGGNTPTAVNLAGFSAFPIDDRVLIQWGTVWENDLIGFNLYRSDSINSEKVLLNQAIIPTDGIGGLGGAWYEYSDSSVEIGNTYHYWLEFINVNGKVIHGPVSVMMVRQIFMPLLLSPSGY